MQPQGCPERHSRDHEPEEDPHPPTSSSTARSKARRTRASSAERSLVQGSDFTPSAGSLPPGHRISGQLQDRRGRASGLLSQYERRVDHRDRPITFRLPVHASADRTQLGQLEGRRVARFCSRRPCRTATNPIGCSVAVSPWMLLPSLVKHALRWASGRVWPAHTRNREHRAPTRTLARECGSRTLTAVTDPALGGVGRLRSPRIDPNVSSTEPLPAPTLERRVRCRSLASARRTPATGGDRRRGKRGLHPLRALRRLATAAREARSGGNESLAQT